MSQTPRNHMEIRNVFTDKVEYLPSFTCVHCNRAVIMNPERTRPRNVCRKCDALVCDYCRGDCNPIARDAERALVDHLGQPWMLRGLKADGSDAHEPVLRVEGQLVLAKDVGYTTRELARMQKPIDGPVVAAHETEKVILRTLYLANQEATNAAL